MPLKCRQMTSARWCISWVAWHQPWIGPMRLACEGVLRGDGPARGPSRRLDDWSPPYGLRLTRVSTRSLPGANAKGRDELHGYPLTGEAHAGGINRPRRARSGPHPRHHRRRSGEGPSLVVDARHGHCRRVHDTSAARRCVGGGRVLPQCMVGWPGGRPPLAQVLPSSSTSDSCSSIIGLRRPPTASCSQGSRTRTWTSCCHCLLMPSRPVGSGARPRARWQTPSLSRLPVLHEEHGQ